MTDKEKLDKIIAEIKRLYVYWDGIMQSSAATEAVARKNQCRELLSFYDILQAESKKEAVIEVEKIMAEVDAKFPKFAKEVGDIHSCDPHFGVNIEEESNNVVCWNKMSEKEKSDFLYDLSHMNIEPTKSVWQDAKDTPVASKTKIVLYTNGKWDMFKAYETKDDHDKYWAGVNQALEEKGVLVKRWAYVEDLLKL